MKYFLLKNTKISIWIVSILLLLNFLPFYISWLLLIVLSIVYSVFSSSDHSKKAIDYPLYALILYALFISIIGLVNISTNGIWTYVRDLIYVSKPLLCVYVLSCIGKKYDYSKEVLFCNFFLYSSIVCALFVVSYFFNNSTNRPEEWTLAFGLYLVLVRNKKYINQALDFVLSVPIILGFALAFSRTSLLILIVLLVFSTFSYRRAIPRLLVLSLLALGAGFIFQKETVLSYFQDIGRSLTEINSNNAWDDYEVVNNWRGFEIYCAQTMYLNGGLGNKIFGFGAGSFVDCFGYSYLVTGESGLPYLHNGYYTVLIKNGAFGIFLLALFAVSHFIFVRKTVYRSNDRKILYAFIVAMLISMWVISGVFCGSQLEFCVLFYWLAKSKTSIASAHKELETLNDKRLLTNESIP